MYEITTFWVKSHAIICFKVIFIFFVVVTFMLVMLVCKNVLFAFVECVVLIWLLMELEVNYRGWSILGG
jgi:hypothetical protein